MLWCLMSLFGKFVTPRQVSGHIAFHRQGGSRLTATKTLYFKKKFKANSVAKMHFFFFFKAAQSECLLLKMDKKAWRDQTREDWARRKKAEKTVLEKRTRYVRRKFRTSPNITSHNECFTDPRTGWRHSGFRNWFRNHEVEFRNMGICSARNAGCIKNNIKPLRVTIIVNSEQYLHTLCCSRGLCVPRISVLSKVSTTIGLKDTYGILVSANASGTMETHTTTGTVNPI